MAGSSGGAVVSPAVLAAVPFLARLTHTVRLDPDSTTEPKILCHWEEVTPDENKDLVKLVGGRSSKTALVADDVTQIGEGTGELPTLVAPAAGAILYDAVVDPATATATLTIIWTKVAGSHAYHCAVGSGTGPFTWSTYHTNDSLGDVDRVTVSGLPIDGTPWYIMLYIDGQQPNRNHYSVTLTQSAQDDRRVCEVLPETIRDPAGSTWLTPANGVRVEYDEPTDSVPITWVPPAGAEEQTIYIGSGAPNDFEAPTAWDIGYSPLLSGTESEYTIADAPTDGTTFYVILWWRIGDVWQGNRYAVTMLPAPNAAAFSLDQAQRLGVKMLRGPDGWGTSPDVRTDPEAPVPEEEIPTDVFVWIHKLTDTKGADAYAYEHLVIERHGIIADTGPLGTEDDYTDHRYWVRLSEVSNSGTDPTDAVTFAALTGDDAKRVTVTNTAEALDESHNLPVDTPVIVQSVRSIDSPHNVRYIMAVGGTGGGGRFLAKIQTAGPDAEADHTDARYWVQEVDDSSADENAPLSLSVVSVANGGRWVTATNREELGIGPSDAGTHAIVKAVTGIAVPARYVMVEEIRFAGSGLRYVFAAYPGQMQEEFYAAKVVCLDGTCPEVEWYKMNGPGFDSQADPPECPE